MWPSGSASSGRSGAITTARWAGRLRGSRRGLGTEAGPSFVQRAKACWSYVSGTKLRRRREAPWRGHSASRPRPGRTRANASPRTRSNASRVTCARHASLSPVRDPELRDLVLQPLDRVGGVRLRPPSPQAGARRGRRKCPGRAGTARRRRLALPRRWPPRDHHTGAGQAETASAPC
jgi:hypothetical protein